MKHPHVLVVDDEPMSRDALVEWLSFEGWHASVAATAKEALAVASDDLDAVLLDYRLPDMNGFDVLHQLRSRHPQLPTIMLTGHDSVPLAVEAIKSGAYHYLAKPPDLDVLSKVLREAVYASAARDRRQPAFARTDATASIVGQSRAIADVRDTIRRLAPHAGSTVLIVGESGTGKDLAAQAIHAASPRASAPLMTVTCTALPHTLLESELFGHERGAFTDAKARRLGLIERADGGSVFFDEIGDMDPALQAKLLRVLETKEYRRVGGTEDFVADVRVIAATNVDLPVAVSAGRFREDLYYRLAVLVLRMPALRERPEDIELLARHFVAKHCAVLGRSPCAITGGALAELRRHAWPGNVRELRNVMERAVVLARGDTIDREDVRLLHRDQLVGVPDAAPPTSAAGGLSVIASERRLVARALAATGGNITHAAQLLGLSRDQVRYRIRKFGLGHDADEHPAADGRRKIPH